jgi:hypothetical protein
MIFLPAIFLLSRPKQKNGGQKNHPRRMPENIVDGALNGV